MVFQTEDRARAKKQHADLAIQMALQGRWNEAVELNRSIIESFPTDVDSFNRLGKAMTELGRYADARDAYNRGLEIDPLNSIAQKNLTRLQTLGADKKKVAPKTANQKISPQMFIEEMGKTGVTILARPDMDVAARLTAGDLVSLGRRNGTIIVKSLGEELIGEIEPKLGGRLIKLMDGGNEYVAAIFGLSPTEVRVFIRETFQDASQTGKLSFPPTITETVRPYTKARLVRRDAGDDTYSDDADESEDWDAGAEPEHDEPEDTADDADAAEDTGTGLGSRGRGRSHFEEEE